MLRKGRREDGNDRTMLSKVHYHLLYGVLQDVDRKWGLIILPL